VLRASGCRFQQLQFPAAAAEHGAVLSMQACTVSGVAASGAVAVKHAQTRATFNKCTLQRAAADLVAVEGGAFAEFLGCSFADASRAGIMAAGSGTRVEAERCSVTACMHEGLRVGGGASAEATECSVRGCERGGVVADGAETEVALSGGSIEDNVGSAVTARGGARVSAAGAEIVASGDAAGSAIAALRVEAERRASASGAARGGSDAEASPSSVSTTASSGIFIKAKPPAVKRGGLFSRALSARGSPRGARSLRGGGASPQEAPFVRSVAGSSCESPAMDTVEPQRSVRRGAGEDAYGLDGPHGVHACGAGTVVAVKECRVRVGAGCGMIVEGRASLSAQACLIGDSAGERGGRNGVQVRGGARGCDSRSSMGMRDTVPAQVVGEGSAAELVECVVRGAEDCGVLVRDSAQIELRACKVRDMRNMHGVAALGRGAAAILRDCSVENSADCGCVAESGASLTLHRVQVRAADTMRAAQMHVLHACARDGYRVQVLRTRHGHALGALGARTALEAINCCVEGAGRDGVYTGSAATLMLSSSSISGVSGQGVHAAGADTSAIITDCDVRACGHNGLLVSGSAHVTVTGCKLLDSLYHGASIMGEGTVVQVRLCLRGTRAPCVHVRGDRRRLVHALHAYTEGGMCR
jgi:Right handed beta helix region